MSQLAESASEEEEDSTQPLGASTEAEFSVPTVSVVPETCRSSIVEKKVQYFKRRRKQ